KARTVAATVPRGTDDLYSSWLDAVMKLAKPVEGTKPSFMATPAYADLHLDSAIAAFGQIKHNYVLLAAESVDEGGCGIPDGSVEPGPEVSGALLEYARRGQQALAQLDPKDELHTVAYFTRLHEVLSLLLGIQRAELAGRALTADEKAWLSMVSEVRPPGGS